MSKRLFTSESVTEGHPDKVCDQVSDAILDAMLAQDPMSRVACETTCTTGMVMVMGEITTTAQVDIPAIVRGVVNDIGFNNPDYGFDGNSCAVFTTLDKQSPDIAMGVDKSFELKGGEEDAYNLHGAGDQGMMFGFACNDTEELMPLPVSLAHKLARRLTDVRKDGTLPYLRPDGKSQVTIEYDENDKPVRVEAVVVSSQHDPIDIEVLRKDITENVIKPIIPEQYLDADTKIYVNPTATSLLAALLVIADLQAERLSLIHTVVIHVTAVALSQVKTRQRLTVALRMHHVTLQKILLLQVLQINVRFSLHMLSVLLVLYLFVLIHSVQVSFQMHSSRQLLTSALIFALLQLLKSFS